MAKQKLRIRAVRLEPEFNKRVERATREGGFSNPSAFIRGAIDQELSRGDVKAGVDAAEDRLAASLDRLSREIRAVKARATGSVCVRRFAMVKTLLTCVAEPPRDAHDQAVARGKVSVRPVSEECRRGDGGRFSCRKWRSFVEAWRRKLTRRKISAFDRTAHAPVGKVKHGHGPLP